MTRDPPIEQLVLASASPFRRQLLESTGLEFLVKTAAVDEGQIFGETPEKLALNRARAKAQAVASERGPTPRLVVGADQVLSHRGVTMDKVSSAEAARERLKVLAGETHYLHSAYVVVEAGGQVPKALAERVLTATMPMRPLSDRELDCYVATGEWRGAVGCYQYEHRGVHLFHGVEADHSTIVGLPLQQVLEDLRKAGIDGLTQPRPPWGRKPL